MNWSAAQQARVELIKRLADMSEQELAAMSFGAHAFRPEDAETPAAWETAFNDLAVIVDAVGDCKFGEGSFGWWRSKFPWDKLADGKQPSR